MGVILVFFWRKKSFLHLFQFSGQYLNIGKLFGTSPGSTDLQEKFIQKVTVFTTKNVILSTKFSIYILHAGYTQSLYKCSVHIYLRHCVNKLQNSGFFYPGFKTCIR